MIRLLLVASLLGLTTATLPAQIEVLDVERLQALSIYNRYYTVFNNFKSDVNTSLSGEYAYGYYFSAARGVTVYQKSNVSPSLITGQFACETIGSFETETSDSSLRVDLRLARPTHFSLLQASEGTGEYILRIAKAGPTRSIGSYGWITSVQEPPYVYDLSGANGPSNETGIIPAGEWRLIALANARKTPETVPTAVRAAFSLQLTPIPAFESVSETTRVFVDGTATLRFRASSGSYQIAWFKDGIVIPGATGTSYQISSARLQDSGTYTIKLTNAAGTFTSDPIIVEVVERTPPEILTVTPSQRLFDGESIELSFTANPTSYDIAWIKDGAIIPGAEGSTYRITAFSSAHEGIYKVRLTNGAGSATSDPIILQPDARLRNIATRSEVGSNEAIVIVGFTIGGTKPRDLLLRGLGPRLGDFGISRPLVDPRIQIFDSAGTAQASNSAWDVGGPGEATKINSAQTDVGTFGLPSGSRDAALALSLSPGSYTLQIDSLGTDNGIALAEVYDRSVAQDDNRITNLSTRAKVGSGEAIVIPGIVIEGRGTQSLLVRAVGPSLAQFGVMGVLANPALRIFDATGAVVAENLDWGQGAESVATTIASAAEATGAFPLLPGTRDAALLVELPAGSYTAQVFGENQGTGIALVEVYTRETTPAGPATPAPLQGSPGR